MLLILYPYWDILRSVSLFSSYTQGLHYSSSLKLESALKVSLYFWFYATLSNFHSTS